MFMGFAKKIKSKRCTVACNWYTKCERVLTIKMLYQSVYVMIQTCQSGADRKNWDGCVS